MALYVQKTYLHLQWETRRKSEFGLTMTDTSRLATATKESWLATTTATTTAHCWLAGGGSWAWGFEVTGFDRVYPITPKPQSPKTLDEV